MPYVRAAKSDVVEFGSIAPVEAVVDDALALVGTPVGLVQS
jgi:hypothetical protein